MALHWNDNRPYNYEDDGDLYDHLTNQADDDRNSAGVDHHNDRLHRTTDPLAQHLADLTVAIGRLERGDAA